MSSHRLPEPEPEADAGVSPTEDAGIDEMDMEVPDAVAPIRDADTSMDQMLADAMAVVDVDGGMIDGGELATDQGIDQDIPLVDMSSDSGGCTTSQSSELPLFGLLMMVGLMTFRMRRRTR